jgi:hypothetical protein
MKEMFSQRCKKAWKNIDDHECHETKAEVNLPTIPVSCKIVKHRKSIKE